MMRLRNPSAWGRFSGSATRDGSCSPGSLGGPESARDGAVIDLRRIALHQLTAGDTSGSRESGGRHHLGSEQKQFRGVTFSSAARTWPSASRFATRRTRAGGAAGPAPPTTASRRSGIEHALPRAASRRSLMQADEMKLLRRHSPPSRHLGALDHLRHKVAPDQGLLARGNQEVSAPLRPERTANPPGNQLGGRRRWMASPCRRPRCCASLRGALHAVKSWLRRTAGSSAATVLRGGA